MAAPRKPKPFSSMPLPDVATGDLDPTPPLSDDAWSAADAAELYPEPPELAMARGNSVKTPKDVGAGTSFDQNEAVTEKPASGGDKGAAVSERGHQSMASGVQEFQTLAIKAVREGFETHMAFMKAFARAKTLSEAVSLQGAYVRRQYDAASAQWRNWTEAAQRLARPGADPHQPDA